MTAAALAPSPLRVLMHVAAMVRYRFFLYAGLLPYLLGAAWAWAIAGRFDAPVFWSGLAGVVLAVIGVEAFNEYFDARMGTDRVFDADGPQPIAQTTFWIGTFAFAGALAGGAAAIFYEAPPIRWSYRGLGEAVIALSYGPWMVLASAMMRNAGTSDAQKAPHGRVPVWR